VKLVIQIPCYNEADTLPDTLADLPKEIAGIQSIDIIIIDDGSHDNTAELARSYGVHVVRHPTNQGLARTFASGLEHALRLGADVIVNTDADNQYPGHYITDLVAPILARQADIVVGNRQVGTIPHFSSVKKWLQGFGSWVVRTISGTNVPDTTSGFRAYSREAALRLNILSEFSYTLETLIQAAKIGLSIVSVPIKTNPPTRPSRLQRSMWHFIKAQASTILRIYAFYEPLRTFSYLAAPFLLSGLALLLRFVYSYLFTEWESNRLLQSVTIGTGLLLIGILILLFGIQADIAGKHRTLTQELLYRLRKLELDPSRKIPTEHRERR